MQQLPLNVPFQRLMGFTIPRNGEFFVCDDNECWSVRLGIVPEVSEIDGSPYDLARRPDFVGAFGAHCNGLLHAGEAEIDYRFDNEESVEVGYRWGEKTGSVSFRLNSGDWFAPSLSEDGAYAILAEPDTLNAYAVYVR